MFQVLILVCSINLTLIECQSATALQVISGPDASDESVCGLYGQTYIADNAIGLSLHDDEYVKVKCTRTSIGKSVG